MFHNGQLLIRLILLLWNSCSTTGVQDLANHQLWNHVNSLNRKIKKIQHFGKYFLLRSPMHIKSIYTSQDFILQLDMIIILPPEVIWSKSHHPNPCYWQKNPSILFHRWICSVVGYFTLLHCANIKYVEKLIRIEFQFCSQIPHDHNPNKIRKKIHWSLPGFYLTSLAR